MINGTSGPTGPLGFYLAAAQNKIWATWARQIRPDFSGNVKVAFGRLKQKQAWNKFLDPNRRTTMDDRRGGALVDSYLWDQGVIDIAVDRWMPADEVMFLDSEHIGFGPLRTRQIAHEILPKQSRELQRGEISGEYTCEVKSQTAHARITGLATSIV